MPRIMAPPPSGEFEIRMTKPFSGNPTYTVEVIGEPNRPATVRVKHDNGSGNTSEKVGEMPKDDVNELMSLISTVRGFPSHPLKDIYGQDAKVDFNTFEIQWTNEEETSSDISEIAGEQKDDFRRVVESIEALGRQFAKNDSAV